jgi:acetoin utilization protein AcuB
MNFTAPVSQFMTSKLITLAPGDTIGMAIDLFRKHRIHHILVVRHKTLQGIISTFDVNLRHSNDSNFLNEKVENIMTTGIATLASTDRLNVAIQLFSENLFHAIPVVDNDEVVGILTTLDIMKSLTAEDNARIMSN